MSQAAENHWPARRLLAVVLAAGLLVAACGSSETAEENREAGGADDSAVEVEDIFTNLAVGDALRGVRIENCDNLAARGLCQWAVNTMYAFTGPNQLSQNGEVSLAYSTTDISSGVQTGAWKPPDTIPNYPDKSVHWRLESDGMFTGAVATVYYDAPSGYPLGERVGLYGSVPSSGNKDAAVLYEISNSPIIVRVTNRLGADVTREGSPQLTSFVADSKAGDPAVVAPGATGYAGGFRSISQDSRYQASYVVGGADTALAGARATINAVIDHTTGLDKGSKCEVSNRQTTGVQLQCRVTVTGGPTGPGTIEVTLSR
jgi:hypothetical protein